ncbi:hypothetical protein ACFWSF_35185 [Streptomyces sp. NPDC058611]|uniref:hypothetical protein n=1 Tax=unclassified Streptomyces TaxID=2593676 RepID=UPI0036663309
MTTLDAYNPPGNLTDLDDDGRKKWHMWLSCRVDETIQGPSRHRVLHDGPRPQFYNATKTPTGDDATDASVTWTAFPRALHSLNSDMERWEAADSDRLNQDEYCEWSVSRNADHKVNRVTFTCEGPEYWEHLAAYNPAKVLELYRTYISPDVVAEDLFPDGAYDPYNEWNNSTSRGAMHLVQPNNTLTAEIELAAAATIRRVIDGREYTQSDELIACSDYGDPKRNSDPKIGFKVNKLAQEGADITLTDPVGLYFDDLNTDGWETPDGSDPKSYWTYLRGDADHPVRAVYEVPDGKGFTVGDIKIRGWHITTGSQIADFITMKLTATACRFEMSTAEPLTACKVRVRDPLQKEMSSPSTLQRAASSPSFRTSRSA